MLVVIAGAIASQGKTSKDLEGDVLAAAEGPEPPPAVAELTV
jgi:hypothetical protein